VMNYQRLYQYRFQDVAQHSRQAVWNEIAAYIYELLGRPRRLLDPAAGRCEFINAVPAAERWVVDEIAYPEASLAEGIQVIEGDVLTAPLPDDYFDGIFVSNFLEHLTSQAQVSNFLAKMHVSLQTNGRIVVLGPNFKYCAADYFDCADHTLALTHLSVAEHLYAAGFDIVRVVPRFLPFSFRGSLPASASLARLYLRMPFAWRLLGRQFLLLGQKP
jgi:Methyltransferase domain